MTENVRLQEEFGDLHRVEGRALAQVVVAHEHHQSTTIVDRRVLTNTTDIAGVLAGGLERRGHVEHHHSGGR